jgi:hypothetical protein
MPISEEALQKEANRFIAVKGEAKVGQAMAAFKALDAQPWWHLVVSMPDGSWAVTRFRDLSPLVEVAGAADIRAADLKTLTASSSVERDSIDTNAAQALAKKSKSGILVVTVDGSVAGILIGSAKRGGFPISSAGLNDLAGGYIDLKDYGSILLSSSRKTVRPKTDPPAESR